MIMVGLVLNKIEVIVVVVVVARISSALVYCPSSSMIIRIRKKRERVNECETCHHHIIN